MNERCGIVFAYFPSQGAVEKVDFLDFFPLCSFYVENQIKGLEFFIFPSFSLLDAVYR